MENKVWQVSNSDWYLRDISGTVKNLEKVIYTLEINPHTGELYLANTGRRFEFEFKVYGLKSDLIKQVITYYDNSKGNVGVLLNGIKGTGKTITAEILANTLDLPIIVIGRKLPGLVSFLAHINTELVILIDEYEKIFDDNKLVYNTATGDDDKKEDATLLSIMDGVFSGNYRRTFILTTNDVWINENMLNRPGRLRYKERFSDLEYDTIVEIIDDLLVNVEFKEAVISYVKTLKIITVDILKAIITEVNIFELPPMKACRYMNLEFAEKEYSIYKVSEDGERSLLDDDISSQKYTVFMTHLEASITATIYFCGQYFTSRAKTKYKPEEPISVVCTANKELTYNIVFVPKDPTHSSFKGMNITYAF